MPAEGLKAGNTTDLTDSMGKSIEEAYQKECAKAGIPVFSPTPVERKALFCAIAQGVVRHLVDHLPEALEILTETTQVGSPLVKVNGVHGMYSQTSDSMVNTRGSSRVTEVNTRGDLY